MQAGSRRHLLVKVSKQYFEDGLTQQEIAASLRISRSTVSRLLTRARDEGIVQITISTPPGLYPDLEKRLEKRFDLLEAVVVETAHYDDPERVAQDLGQVAAAYLARTIQAGDVIGFAWGITMKAMVDAMQPKQVRGARVVQMNGGLTSQMTDIHATSLTRNLAARIGGECYMLQAPGVVDNPDSQPVFMADAHVQQVFDLASRADIAFFGIGIIARDTLWGRAGLLSQAVIEELTALGAVGDIMSRYFDGDGQMVQSSLCRRVVGIPIPQLLEIKRRVGVAGGRGKSEAILGALRGGYLNILITDQVTAGCLLAGVDS